MCACNRNTHTTNIQHENSFHKCLLPRFSFSLRQLCRGRRLRLPAWLRLPVSRSHILFEATNMSPLVHLDVQRAAEPPRAPTRCSGLCNGQRGDITYQRRNETLRLAHLVSVKAKNLKVTVQFSPHALVDSRMNYRDAVGQAAQPLPHSSIHMLIMSIKPWFEFAIGSQHYISLFLMSTGPTCCGADLYSQIKPSPSSVACGPSLFHARGKQCTWKTSN